MTSAHAVEAPGRHYAAGVGRDAILIENPDAAVLVKRGNDTSDEIADIDLVQDPAGRVAPPPPPPPQRQHRTPFCEEIRRHD